MDIQQVLTEAKNRWLKPAEVLDILENYKAYQFQLNEQPPDRPESGKLFLFDCKIQRYYRKDGHNWRKKPDGRTVKEAHEKLKVGSEQMLACYYAHGEGDLLLQRRVYWRLKEKRIVLVHYLEVEKALNRVKHVPAPGSLLNVPDSSFPTDQLLTESANQSLDSDEDNPGWEDDGRPEITVESTHLVPFSAVSSLPKDPPNSFWSTLNDNIHPQNPSSQFPIFRDQTPLNPSQQPINLESTGLNQVNTNTFQEGFTGRENPFDGTLNWGGIVSNENGPQTSFMEKIESDLKTEPVDSRVGGAQPDPEPPTQSVRGFFTRSVGGRMDQTASKRMLSGFEDLTEGDSNQESSFEGEEQNEGEEYNFQEVSGPVSAAIVEDMLLDSTGRQSLGRCSTGGRAGGGGSLGNWAGLYEFPKFDSFNKWANEIYGEPIDSEPFPETASPVFMEEPAHIWFEVQDFSPTTCCIKGGTKMLIAGNTQFDKDQKWGVLFDNVEVEAEIVQPGVLKCHAPSHVAGTVKFAVTQGNGFACSNLLEVEYKSSSITSSHVNGPDENLQIRLIHLLMQTQENGNVTSSVSSGEDTNDWIWLEDIKKEENPPWFVQEQLMIMLLKKKLEQWVESPNAELHLKQQDYGGLSVIHMVAALGYDWAIPILARKLENIDLPDGRGRTALHWAAANGREKAIIKLLDAGAMPTTLVKRGDFQEGATPADLASWSGHKGIAARLAEKALHDAAKQIPYMEMSSMSLKDRVTRAGVEAVTRFKQGLEAGGVREDGIELERRIKQSAEEAELIKCVDRRHSIRKLGVDWVEVVKRDEGLDETDMEIDPMFVNSVMKQIGFPDRNTAALKIQQHYRGYKDRTNFQQLKQKVIYLQALARGKLTRQRFLKLRFAVGIVEKAILRWRRRTKGLSFMDNLPHRGMPAQIEGNFVVHALPPELIPRDKNRKDVEDWKDVGGKGVGLQRALGHVTTLVPSLSGRMQYAAFQKRENEK